MEELQQRVWVIQQHALFDWTEDGQPMRRYPLSSRVAMNIRAFVRALLMLSITLFGVPICAILLARFAGAWVFYTVLSISVLRLFFVGVLRTISKSYIAEEHSSDIYNKRNANFLAKHKKFFKKAISSRFAKQQLRSVFTMHTQGDFALEIGETAFHVAQPAMMILLWWYYIPPASTLELAQSILHILGWSVWLILKTLSIDILETVLVIPSPFTSLGGRIWGEVYRLGIVIGVVAAIVEARRRASSPFERYEGNIIGLSSYLQEIGERYFDRITIYECGRPDTLDWHRRPTIEPVDVITSANTIIDSLSRPDEPSEEGSATAL